jgi:hypothetical protein
MHDESAQEGFLRETKAQAISEGEIPSLPELTSGQIPVMVEAEQHVDDGEYTQSPPCDYRGSSYAYMTPTRQSHVINCVLRRFDRLLCHRLCVR